MKKFFYQTSVRSTMSCEIMFGFTEPTWCCVDVW